MKQLTWTTNYQRTTTLARRQMAKHFYGEHDHKIGLTIKMSVPPREDSVSIEGSSERGKTLEEDPFAPRFL